MKNHALQKKLHSLEPEELERVYQNVLKNDSGDLILEDLRNRAWCFLPYNATDGDGYSSDFKDGARSIILHLETMLNPKPTEYTTGEASEAEPQYLGE